MDPLTISVVFLIVMVASVSLELVTPSFGLLTLVGFLFMIASVVMGFKSSPTAGFTMFAINFAVFPTALACTMYAMKRSGLVHTSIIRPGPMLDADDTGPAHDLAWLIGRQGKSVTPLRPSGAVVIEEKRFEVITDGKYVDSGVAVKVLSVEGNHVLVEEIKEGIESVEG